MDRAMVRPARFLDHLGQPVHTCCAAFDFNTSGIRAHADRALLHLHRNRSHYMEFFPALVRVRASTELEISSAIRSRIGYSGSLGLCGGSDLARNRPCPSTARD